MDTFEVAFYDFVYDNNLIRLLTEMRTLRLNAGSNPLPSRGKKLLYLILSKEQAFPVDMQSISQSDSDIHETQVDTEKSEAARLDGSEVDLMSFTPTKMLTPIKDENNCQSPG